MQRKSSLILATYLLINLIFQPKLFSEDINKIYPKAIPICEYLLNEIKQGRKNYLKFKIESIDYEVEFCDNDKNGIISSGDYLKITKSYDEPAGKIKTCKERTTETIEDHDSENGIEDTYHKIKTMHTNKSNDTLKLYNKKSTLDNIEYNSTYTDAVDIITEHLFEKLNKYK